MMYKFKNAEAADLDSIAAIENVCFPPNEAASLESFRKRIDFYPEHFWLLEFESQIIGYVNGMVTNQRTISDELFSNAELHDRNGKWQTIFGIAVSPQYRNNGHAARLLEHLIDQAREDGRAGVILTCKDHLIAYYERFGFVDMGISGSVHGGEVWHDMTLEF